MSPPARRPGRVVDVDALARERHSKLRPSCGGCFPEAVRSYVSNKEALYRFVAGRELVAMAEAVQIELLRAAQDAGRLDPAYILVFVSWPPRGPARPTSLLMARSATPF